MPSQLPVCYRSVWPCWPRLQANLSRLTGRNPHAEGSGLHQEQLPPPGVWVGFLYFASLHLPLRGCWRHPESSEYGNMTCLFLQSFRSLFTKPSSIWVERLTSKSKIYSKRSRPQSIFITQGFSSGGIMRLFELHLTPVH